MNYQNTYNHHIPQRALNHLSPIEALQDGRRKSPELFVKRVYKQAELDRSARASDWFDIVWRICIKRRVAQTLWFHRSKYCSHCQPVAREVGGVAAQAPSLPRLALQIATLDISPTRHQAGP